MRPTERTPESHRIVTGWTPDTHRRYPWLTLKGLSDATSSPAWTYDQEAPRQALNGVFDAFGTPSSPGVPSCAHPGGDASLGLTAACGLVNMEPMKVLLKKVEARLRQMSPLTLTAMGCSASCWWQSLTACARQAVTFSLFYLLGVVFGGVVRRAAGGRCLLSLAPPRSRCNVPMSFSGRLGRRRRFGGSLECRDAPGSVHLGTGWLTAEISRLTRHLERTSGGAHGAVGKRRRSSTRPPRPAWEKHSSVSSRSSTTLPKSSGLRTCRRARWFTSAPAMNGSGARRARSSIASQGPGRQPFIPPIVTR